MHRPRHGRDNGGIRAGPQGRRPHLDPPGRHINLGEVWIASRPHSSLKVTPPDRVVRGGLPSNSQNHKDTNHLLMVFKSNRPDELSTASASAHLLQLVLKSYDCGCLPSCLLELLLGCCVIIHHDETLVLLPELDLCLFGGLPPKAGGMMGHIPDLSLQPVDLGVAAGGP